MSEYAIRVDKLSKRYRIGLSKNRADRKFSGLRTILSPISYLISSLREPSPEEVIWALNGVSFEVKKGEVMGIVGRNGAGKSTLLKILSRITEPTSGKALVDGRVGSLLEVGTGFHPELTGRENIYLNGAILGMKKDEINRKFDEIVAFAEVDKFIDTPVKRYSSGMYVRLAFSVAAHLEPEVLLVDEVLAVGDVAFQQKCLNRIKDLTSSGMTILLVSHNLAAIQSSCNQAIFINQGKLESAGNTQEVIQNFQMSLHKNVGQQGEQVQGFGNAVSILGFDMFDASGTSKRDFEFGEPIHFKIDLLAHQKLEHPMINLGLRRGDGVTVCNFNNWYDDFDIDFIEGKCALEGWLPPLRLVPDFYEIHVLVWHQGGNHVSGDPTHSKPLAWSMFGNFNIGGVGLNSEDGVMQIPAHKWRFQRGVHSSESGAISEKSLFNAFKNLNEKRMP